MEEIDAAHYFKIIMVIQQGPKNRKKSSLGFDKCLCYQYGS